MIINKVQHFINLFIREITWSVGHSAYQMIVIKKEEEKEQAKTQEEEI
jgi:hypothetical protein